jgi:hypothetical protein
VTDGQSKALTYLLLEETMTTWKFQVTELGVGTVPHPEHLDPRRRLQKTDPSAFVEEIAVDRPR